MSVCNLFDGPSDVIVVNNETEEVKPEVVTLTSDTLNSWNNNKLFGMSSVSRESSSSDLMMDSPDQYLSLRNSRAGLQQECSPENYPEYTNNNNSELLFTHTSRERLPTERYPDSRHCTETRNPFNFINGVTNHNNNHNNNPTYPSYDMSFYGTEFNNGQSVLPPNNPINKFVPSVPLSDSTYPDHFHSFDVPSEEVLNMLANQSSNTLIDTCNVSHHTSDEFSNTLGGNYDTYNITNHNHNSGNSDHVSSSYEIQNCSANSWNFLNDSPDVVDNDLVFDDFENLFEDDYQNCISNHRAQDYFSLHVSDI